ncbi:hypothetical protein TrST_g13611 [Triparma strigata]|uniref:Uncharacterized protein n=1 Tax=Triparma strigata TaxID=1606541 RepID=A0A9W7BWB5_9STRA|nr:hypothetical protein TrST_g13611 [Triparma strigata]
MSTRRRNHTSSAHPRGNRPSIVDISRDAKFATSSKMRRSENVRDRMDAAGQFSIIAALMTGSAISFFTTELPPNISDHDIAANAFLISSASTVGLSMILLFQQTLEYIFCLRLLASYGTEVSGKIIRKFRWFRRIGEVSFFLAVPAFFISSSTLAYVKGNEISPFVGRVNFLILTALMVFLMVMLVCMKCMQRRVNMEATKQEEEELELEVTKQKITIAHSKGGEGVGEGGEEGKGAEMMRSTEMTERGIEQDQEI